MACRPILLLKKYSSIIDSIDSEQIVKLHEFHSPEHNVTYNGPNTHQDTIEDMMRKITKRAASLLKLETIILNAWDVCHPTEGKHTVMTEVVQKFTFNDDPDAKPVEIGALSIMGLEKAPEGPGKGSRGLDRARKRVFGRYSD
jgi:hypothetical protein